MSETVTLREITPDNEAAVRALAAAFAQGPFVVSASESLDEAATSPDARPWYRAIYAGDQPVGFVMLSFDVSPGHPEHPWRYFLWRLLIDARYQRRGYGRAAMALVIDVVRGNPGATDLFTSVYPGEGGPAPFYRSLGFESTGEWFDGEEVYRLRLSSRYVAEHPPPRITPIQGDITTQDVDAIVNAANTALRPGGGVDGAITRAAGSTALADRERVIHERGIPPLPTGQAVATVGGALRARWIIHTAGPVYSGSAEDPILLASCHVESLRVADQLGELRVAFPAISTGVYGYPLREAAPVAIDAVLTARTDVREVRFVLFDERALTAFSGALTDRG